MQPGTALGAMEENKAEVVRFSRLGCEPDLGASLCSRS
ncbi:MAG: hypothetical protein ACI9XB_004121 [Gammaproteobacteria bacterium]